MVNVLGVQWALIVTHVTQHHAGAQVLEVHSTLAGSATNSAESASLEILEIDVNYAIC